MPERGFHSQDGWYFKRAEDGGVILTVTQGDFEAQVHLDDSTWASAVASVSARSETGGTYRAALDFHNGRT